MRRNVWPKRRPSRNCFHNCYIGDGNASDTVDADMVEYFYDTSNNFKFEPVSGPIVGQVFDLIIVTGCLP